MMAFFKARKINLLLVNGLGLYLCLFMTIAFVFIDKKMKASVSEIEITDAFVTALQAPANTAALKTLLAANEENKAAIRSGLNIGFYLFIFTTLIFIANLIIIIAAVKSEGKSIAQPSPNKNNHL